ncbi:hypothetical protein LTR85_000719 [Meristemomyces frigidus]|nr:hypothetical protein LTR85_000719 [Meristemomyces frigidus]
MSAKTRGGAARKGPASFNFEAMSAAERKRKAEESINDKLVALTDTVRRMSDNQNILMESNKAMVEAIKGQAEEIKALKALLKDNNVRQQSYSEAVTGRQVVTNERATEKQADTARIVHTRKTNSLVKDERAVSIDMGRFKGAKNNFAAIKENLEKGLKVNKVTENLTITCLRPGPGERIDVVFANKEEALEIIFS